MAGTVNERWAALSRPWVEGMMAGDAEAGHGEWGRVLCVDDVGVYVSEDFAEHGDPVLDDVYPNWSDHATVGALWGLASQARDGYSSDFDSALFVACEHGPTDPRVVPWLLGVLESA